MPLLRSLAAPFALALACLIPVLAASCGGEEPPPQTPPPPPTPALTAPPEATGAPTAEAADAAPPGDAATASATPSAAPTGGPPAPWDSLTKEQKTDYMKTTVMPKMKDLFQAFDGAHYQKFGCKTCHGDGVKDGTFKMPNAKLPKLNPADSFRKHMDKKPDMTKFMMNKVLPQMAGLMGEPPYDPATQKGFGCFECHTMEK